MSTFAALMVFMLGLLSACNVLTPFLNHTTSQDTQASGDALPLMTIYSHGGLCLYGECISNITIYTDGTLRYETGDREGEMMLNPREIADLATAIYEADYDVLRSEPFTELCPTTYDGQETIFTFHIREVEEIISSCEYLIDEGAPIFAVIYAIFENYSDILLA